MRILVLEDSRSNQVLIKARLEKSGHQVEVVGNGHQGFVLATSNIYDIVLSDIGMPHWDGFKFIEAMQVVCPQLPIVIISSSCEDDDVCRRLLGYGNVIDFLPKPFDFERLYEILARIRVQTHDSMNKMARIVCTIGPACATSDILGRMILAGMDVARLNFSHGSYEQHAATLSAIRAAEERWGKPIAVLQDLCGPKIRTGVMDGGAVSLRAGSMVVIQAAPCLGSGERFSTILPEIIPDLKNGDPILLDDGLLELRVVREGTDEVTCEVVAGGLLGSNKGMNLPASKLSLPSITEKDWRDLDWALDHSVDYVALSFVRSAEDIQAIKEHIRAAGKRDLRVVAKIEKPEAVNHIREIIEVSDAIMIARGDLGVELPAARVPRIQQEIIRLCWEHNTPVITATQMLDSMTGHSRPTRAEVTDVSMAIKEGTDAVMLSQETATGVDPVNVVRTMASIICEEERYSSLTVEQYQQLIHDSTAHPALTAVASLNGNTATLLLDPAGRLYPQLSKWNRKVPSLLVTRSLHVARHASLYKNITSLIIREDLDTEAMIDKAMRLAMEWGYVKSGDILAVVEGERNTEGGLDQIGLLQLIRVPGD
ncbi:MAG: pyruvate kinase [Desulfobulbaceae bacterium]|nr:MAG: pyruvate kinase [Desulfobulbaceae bacterium]